METHPQTPLAETESVDYVAIATDYARKCKKDRKHRTVGRWTRLAAIRFLNDLQRAKKPDAPFTFDAWYADDACDFIEKLPHVKGVWTPPTLKLHESDVFFIVNLFGFRSPEDGRRFSTALKAIARKNAKSTIAAGIALYCQVCEGEVGPEVVSAATTGSQARIVFDIAKRMVEKTAPLREAFNMAAYANAIASYDNGGTFKPINAKASTQDGLNPSVAVLDEIHAHKDADLLNVLRSAAGARANPLFLFCTTEGYESPGPWHELRHFAKQVLEGVVEADHFLVVYYAVDDDDDDFDEAAWRKSNPLMDVNPILLKEIRKEAIEAKQMPGKLAEFRIKRLNRPSATAQGWIDFQHWKKGAQPVDIDYLSQFPCYGGLDLASNVDLASFRLVWPVNGQLYTKGWRWTCEKTTKKRTERGTVPYAAWIEAGHLIECPGEIIDYDAIFATIVKASQDFQLELLKYDPWNARQLAAKLGEENVNVSEFIQGPKSFHPAMKEFERVYLAHKLAYGAADPLLTWCAANLVVRRDVNQNMAPDKNKSAEKIDDMVALIMAVGASIDPQELKPYADHGLRVVNVQ